MKCKVICADGQHLIQTPNGEILPQVVFTRVFDGPVKGVAYAIIKLEVDLENTKPDED